MARRVRAMTRSRYMRNANRRSTSYSLFRRVSHCKVGDTIYWLLSKMNLLLILRKLKELGTAKTKEKIRLLTIMFVSIYYLFRLMCNFRRDQDVNKGLIKLYKKPWGARYFLAFVRERSEQFIVLFLLVCFSCTGGQRSISNA